MIWVTFTAAIIGQTARNTFSFDAILPRENHQAVVKIIRGEEEENLVPNFEKKTWEIKKFK